MQSYQELLSNLSSIEGKLGYVFKDKSLLAMAFIHKSFFNENRQELPGYNERLEFLGDSVLGLLICEYLYGVFSEETEGHLAHRKSHLIEAKVCAVFLRKLGLEDAILVGKGEKMNGARGKESIQADLFEAILAAIYLDGGFSAVRDFFWRKFQEGIDALLQSPLKNWKADLQDYYQKRYQKVPSYQTLQESGPEHKKKFVVGVFWKGDLLGTGEGPSKKEAEQLAAEQALKKLEANGG